MSVSQAKRFVRDGGRHYAAPRILIANAIGVAKTIIANRPVATDAPQAPLQATPGFVPLPLRVIAISFHSQLDSHSSIYSVPFPREERYTQACGSGGGTIRTTIDRPKALMRGRSAKMRLFLLCLVPWVGKEKRKKGRRPAVANP